MKTYEEISDEVVTRVLGSLAAGQAQTPVREVLPGVLQVECVRAGAADERERYLEDRSRLFLWGVVVGFLFGVALLMAAGWLLA